MGFDRKRLLHGEQEYTFHAEVPGAGDRVAMEQVVRADLDAQEGPHQLPHRIQVVVDALQEDGVVVERHPGTQ